MTSIINDKCFLCDMRKVVIFNFTQFHINVKYILQIDKTAYFCSDGYQTEQRGKSP